MADMNVKAVGIPEIQLDQSPAAKIKREGGESFQKVLESALDQMNEVNLKADQAIEKLATGEIQDVHQVMLAVEKANLTFTTMMQIRNKLIEAYNQVLQMRF